MEAEGIVVFTLQMEKSNNRRNPFKSKQQSNIEHAPIFLLDTVECLFIRKINIYFIISKKKSKQVD